VTGMFCVECGSEDELYGHLCRNCLLSKNLVVPPEYLTVEVCSSCFKVMEGSVWKAMPHEDMASTLLATATKTHSQVEKVRWTVPNFSAEKGEHRILCTAHALIGREELDLDFEVRMRIRLQRCPSCSRQAGDYYEAILQLRIDGLDLKKAEVELAIEIDIVFKTLDEHAGTAENAFLTKYSPVKGGMDFYLGSLALARILANKFRSRFGAVINESPSLVGMKDGKDLYRSSILVRFPSIREGDVVALDRTVHVVESGDGKILVLKNVRNGKIVRVPTGDVHLRIVAKFHEIKEAVVVTHDRSSIQILDPDSMVAVTVSKPPYLKRFGETVPVVRYDDALYVV